MRRYVSTQLERRYQAAAAQLEGRAIDNDEPTPRNMPRELAEKIVKVLRQNPSFANSGEYDRIISAINDYTQAIQEQA